MGNSMGPKLFSHLRRSFGDSEVHTLGIIGGLLFFLMIAVSGCSDSESENTQGPTVPPTMSTSTATPMLTNTPSLAPVDTPTADPTGTSGPLPLSPTPESLPDLVVSLEASLRSPSRESFCTQLGDNYNPTVEVTVEVENVGDADAGTFVVELNGYIRETVKGLQAKESIRVVLSGGQSTNRVVVDANSEIKESNESNNTAEVWIAVPTLEPPPTCTPPPPPQ